MTITTLKRGIKHGLAFAGVCLLLATLFLATGGPKGGFGGGRGGFSSSRSSSRGGGFGGGGFSSPSRSYGGYRGGYGWGGPRIFFIGGGGVSLLFTLVVVGGIVLVVGAAAVAGWAGNRYAMVNVAVNLRNGERYARRLDALLADSDFTTPSGRTRALHRLAKQIDPADIVEGFVTVPNRFSDRDKVGETAETLARAQMNRIGIQADAVNVANTEGQSVQIESTRTGGNGRGGGPDAAACVIAIVATVRRSAVAQITAGGGEQDALRALQGLYETTGKDLDALYFYYAPTADAPLDPHAANRLFLDLRATAHAA